MKVFLIIVALFLAASIFSGGGSAFLPFFLGFGFIALTGLFLSGLFSAVSAIVGIVLGLGGLILGAVLLLGLAPVLLPLLLLALPFLIVAAIIGSLFSICGG